jgi:hypothetical protein
MLCAVNVSVPEWMCCMQKAMHSNDYLCRVTGMLPMSGRPQRVSQSSHSQSIGMHSFDAQGIKASNGKGRVPRGSDELLDAREWARSCLQRSAAYLRPRVVGGSGIE